MVVGNFGYDVVIEKSLPQEEDTGGVEVPVLGVKCNSTMTAVDDEKQVAHAVEVCREPAPGGEAVVIVEPPVVTEHKKKRRRRASEAREKNFDELYTSTGETLGRGAFGDVRTFRHVDTNVDYAVKFIKTSLRRSREKVLKEIEILMRCRSHPNIVDIFQFFERPTEMILVFEKLEGGNLIHNAWNQKSLTEEDISQVVKHIASGLYFLHKFGVAHRDLKPDNILCVHTSSLVPLKLIDFDLASELVLSKTNSIITTPRLGSPVGSTEFMAPEVVRTWQNVGYHTSCSYDKRCDLWSLGVILYLLICGYLPFGDVRCGKDCGWLRGQKCVDCQNLTFELIENGQYSFPDEEWSSVSVEAKELVAKLLVRNPWSRLLASDVLHHEWLSEEGAHARSSSIIVPERKPAEQVSACVASITAISQWTSVVPIDEICENFGVLLDLDINEIERDGSVDAKQTAEVCEQQQMEDKAEEIAECEIEIERICNKMEEEEEEEDWCIVELEQAERRWSDEDDELFFRMSDIEDGGVGEEWPGKEGDDLESLPSLLMWSSEASQPRLDEDADSGNGNSTDSGSVLLHCVSFTLLHV